MKVWSCKRSMPEVEVQGHRPSKFCPNLRVSGGYLLISFIDGYTMMHKTFSGIEEVSYCFSSPPPPPGQITNLAPSRGVSWRKLIFQFTNGYESIASRSMIAVSAEGHMLGPRRLGRVATVKSLRLDLFAVHTIPPLWNGTRSWNPSSWKTRSCLSWTANTVDSDGLATNEPGHQQQWHWWITRAPRDKGKRCAHSLNTDVIFIDHIISMTPSTNCGTSSTLTMEFRLAY